MNPSRACVHAKAFADFASGPRYSGCALQCSCSQCGSIRIKRPTGRRKCELIGAGALRYPPKARRYKYVGQVVVGFSIGADGSVVGARIADADPPGVFERSALSHIRTWKYNPPMHDGKNVQVDDVYVRLIFEPDR